MKPCHIRKNTKELRDKLRKLGIKCNHGKVWGKYLCVFKLGDEFLWVASPEWDLKNNPCYSESIDCGDNEEKFLNILKAVD